MIVLSLNAGSSSLRYGLYEVPAQGETVLLTKGIEEQKVSHNIAEDDQVKVFQERVRKIFATLKASKQFGSLDINAIGCRVVHGGEVFTNPTVVDTSVLKQIRILASLAPLHNKIDAGIIEVCRGLLPDIPTVAVFDTAFHCTLPQVASTYAIPSELSKRLQIKRYGFHGISHKFTSQTATELLGVSQKSSRVITCHLGNGSSICAIKDGQSIDTSMGMTPLEGLVMGTRSGDLDPGLVMYLINQCGYNPAELESMLNHQSGLLGLSGVDSDIRNIEKAAQQGNPDAALALEVFSYRIAKYIGSYAVILGGVDALVFSGGIGENCPSIRARICALLSLLNIELDPTKNLNSSDEFLISTQASAVPVWVIRSDENLQIAKEVAVLVNR